MNCQPRAAERWIAAHGEWAGLPYTVTLDGGVFGSDHSGVREGDLAEIHTDEWVYAFSVTGGWGYPGSLRETKMFWVTAQGGTSVNNVTIEIGFDLDPPGGFDRSEVRWGEIPSQTSEIAKCTMNWEKTK